MYIVIYVIINQHLKKLVIRKCFIVLLRSLSGNVQPTPPDFKARSGFGIIHWNVRGLLPKLDLINIWADSAVVDVLVLSEPRLKNSSTDKDASIKGYSVFCCDRFRKGGGLVRNTEQMS